MARENASGMSGARYLQCGALRYPGQQFLHVRPRPRRVELATNDERRGGDLREYGPQVEVKGAVQHGAHEVLVGPHHGVDKHVECLSLRTSREQGIDQPFGEPAVCFACDPLV